MSYFMIVRCLAWKAHKFVSSNNDPMRYTSEASWRASTAVLWKWMSFLKSWATSRTKHWNGALQIKRSANFGSLKAAIERNVKVVFWVRVWHCVFTIDAHSHWTYRHHARTVPMRLFDTSSRWQCCPCHLWHLLSARPPCCLFSPSHGCFLL
jgi:hypothetical protein